MKTFCMPAPSSLVLDDETTTSSPEEAVYNTKSKRSSAHRMEPSLSSSQSWANAKPSESKSNAHVRPRGRTFRSNERVWVRTYARLAQVNDATMRC